MVIPCYNHGRFLAECIDSVLAQTVPAQEILVVDDGSTRSTTEAARHYSPDVRYIRTPNGGPASARNLGFEQTTVRLLLFVDAEDALLPNAVEALRRRDPSRARAASAAAGKPPRQESSLRTGGFRRLTWPFRSVGLGRPLISCPGLVRCFCPRQPYNR